MKTYHEMVKWIMRQVDRLAGRGTSGFLIYTDKPRLYKVIRFDGNNLEIIRKHIKEDAYIKNGILILPNFCYGDITANVGDYIVISSVGGQYVCSHEKFVSLHERL